jgi:L-aminopeptidase/D-esterase-like protein
MPSSPPRSRSLTLAAQMAELELDFPGLRIGVAEYEEGPTGCTVFHFVRGAVQVVHDIRGGSPGVIGTPGFADAICFAGGSAYGLEAACGVQDELLDQRGGSTAWDEIAICHGAIIYDFGPRQNSIFPDRELGRRALREAREGVFPCGAHGAGRSATVGKTFGFERREASGQGGAFRVVGASRVAVFTVVNAVGAVVDRNGNVVRGHYDAATRTRTPLVQGLEDRLAAPPGNTTLTLVVTNQKLDARTHRQLAAQVHASMARAIQPFHALTDGDVLFAATTDEVAGEALDSVSLGVIASELAWDAVLAAVAD